MTDLQIYCFTDSPILIDASPIMLYDFTSVFINLDRKGVPVMTNKAPQPAVPTKEAGLGYPTIEKLLETEKFEDINKSFSNAYNSLEKIAVDSDSGLKKKKSATKAMQAYELTTELLNELLKIKYQIVKVRDEEAKKKKKK